MKKQRLNTHIYVTNECNLKCKHCYSAFNNAPGSYISIDEIIDIIVALEQEYDVYFDIEGGELFLRKDIGELFERLEKKHLNRITVTTNGTIYPNIEEKYFRELDEFRVSIEGHTDTFQQDMRGITLDKVLKNCLKWNKSGIPVVVRTTLNKKNCSYIFEMFEKYLPLGFKRFSFYEFQSVGRGASNADDYKLASEDIESIFNDICEISKKYNEFEYIKYSLSKARQAIFNKFMSNSQNENTIISNLSEIPSLTINYDGELGYCPWELSSKGLGKYSKSTFISQVQDIIEHYSLIHDCPHCTATRVLYKGNANL